MSGYYITMFENFKMELSNMDTYYYITIIVLVGIFIYIFYDLFHVKGYHYYQNKFSEGFVSNIKEEDRIRRVDMAEKVLDKLKKENQELDAYLQKKSFKDTYEDIIFEINELVNKNMLGLISNVNEVKGWKMYQIVKQVNALQVFKGSLTTILNNLDSE